MPFDAGANVYGPLIAFVVIGLLALLLRWTFGREERHHRRRVVPDEVHDYGLLCAAAITEDREAAEVIRARLERAGVRATLASGTDGRIRVLVFEDQLRLARRLVG